jgi:hypothetical protein
MAAGNRHIATSYAIAVLLASCDGRHAQLDASSMAELTGDLRAAAVKRQNTPLVRGGDEGAIKSFRQLIGHALLPFGQAAVAVDEGAGHVEEIIDILGKQAAIVDAGGGETVTGGEQQGEPAAHAEAVNEQNKSVIGTDADWIAGRNNLQSKCAAEVGYHRLAQRCGGVGDPRGLPIPVGRVGGLQRQSGEGTARTGKQRAWDRALRFSVEQFSAN